jgi:hypothetical protein
MKKRMAMVALSVAVLAGVAVARPRPTKGPSDAEVQAAIDARLHQLLKQLNDKHR